MIEKIRTLENQLKIQQHLSVPEKEDRENCEKEIIKEIIH